ncbi:MAG: SdpI family protein [Lachnospiraceae bacterium]|jgi:uncharacterized membrane protein|nr:SdpI family protein [Lachnospiraceae bacterium]
MWFWWFMIICDLVIPILMIFTGRMMWKHTPKNINGIIGYRTRRSMKNMDTWKFAHHFCGKLWYKIGWIMFVLSIILHLSFYGHSTKVIGIFGVVISTIQVIILIVPIFLTECVLKKNFTN